MARFYSIQIDSIYLTDDGTITGDGCKLSVTNVEDLLTTVIGVAIPSVGGGAVLQLVPWGAGKQFDVQIETLLKPQWDDLVDLINTTLELDDDLIVTGTGDIGDFSVTVKPFPVKPYTAQSFINGRIRGVNLKFITV